MPRYICSLPNEKKAGRIPELITDDLEKIEDFARRWDRPGRGVYDCVGVLKEGARRRSREAIAELARLHVDIDFKDIIDSPDNVGEPEFEHACDLLKRLTTCLCGDPAPAHPAALLRRPGTHNTKRGKPVLCKVMWRGGDAVDITEIEILLDRLQDAPLFARRARGNGHDERLR